MTVTDVYMWVTVDFDFKRIYCQFIDAWAYLKKLQFIREKIYKVIAAMAAVDVVPG